MPGQNFWRCAVALAVLSQIFPLPGYGQTRSQGETLTIEKIDPPNWWVQMPAPMLLVRGEGLGGARFSLSDASLKIEKATVSENGHWAQLWLGNEPDAPETVTLRAVRGSE